MQNLVRACQYAVCATWCCIAMHLLTHLLNAAGQLPALPGVLAPGQMPVLPSVCSLLGNCPCSPRRAP
eukprot:115923-Chlamydomonas_euryale.AAC.1